MAVTSASSTGTALVLLRDRRAFEGQVELRSRYVAVAERQRWRTGPNFRLISHGRRGAWTFPLGQVREVRWR
jgi:hypothetical protein